MIVAGRFFEHLFTLHVFQVERTQIFFGYEIGGFILVSRHISVTNLAGEVVHVILVEGVFVRICVIIAEGVAVFGLGGVLCSEPQAVAIDAVCQRKFEVDFELQVFFVDFLVAFG